ncbi:hypothetical protein [Pontibacter fetidus]|uniref:Uncharacterized protein n=1 Tax=Pontibacter fetidus TaxID=2700082 RepID=A0A6B2H5B1_9BACT|nr:hypothetical protein [Pontibacter fetidus]NDK54970.1 hypothetical protein [Pontibacter fetidus]
MKPYILLLLAFALLSAQPAGAQHYSQLHALQGHTSQVHYSTGHKQRAETIAHRIDEAMAYYQQMLGFKPAVTLLILSPDDWTRYTKGPMVYGMPHYTDDQTLIVAAEDNPFWKSFIPPLNQLPQDLSKQIREVYQDDAGNLSMQPFFDLLALHELGHAFHFQAGLNMQRKWLGELFTNTLLHTYIAEKEPAALPALTLFPRMVVSSGASEYTYTSLQDADQRYNEIGQKHPKNYGWYQSRWHIAAGNIYEAGGKQVSKRWWDAFKSNKEKLTDEQLTLLLAEKADKSIADMIRNWDRETVK